MPTSHLHRILIGTLPFALWAQALAAMESVAKPASAQARVVFSSETRSRGSGQLTLNLLIETEGLGAGAQLIRAKITRAVDDAGRNVPIQAPPSTSGLRLDFSATSFPANPVLVSNVRVEAPARTVAALAEIEGQVEFFRPSESNGSILRIASLVSHEGRIEDPALSRRGIELRRMTAESWAEYSGARFFPTPPDFNEAFVLLIRDPASTLLGIELQDEQGKPVPPRVTSSGGDASGRVVILTLNGPPRPDTQLVLYLAIPEAIFALPFRIQNVPLP